MASILSQPQCVHTMAATMAPSHYLNQCWLISTELLWHLHENNPIFFFINLMISDRYSEITLYYYIWYPNDQRVKAYSRVFGSPWCPGARCGLLAGSGTSSAVRHAHVPPCWNRWRTSQSLAARCHHGQSRSTERNQNKWYIDYGSKIRKSFNMWENVWLCNEYQDLLMSNGQVMFLQYTV